MPSSATSPIHFSIVPCPLDYLLVAATSSGVCAIALGDSDESLAADLHHRFPAATLQRDDEALQAYVKVLLAFLEGRATQLDLPLDVTGTPFQRRVWDALRAIGYGQTRSYTQIAAGIGQPSAVRAVARACASNPVGLVVPCHRVLRGDGSFSGYRWGVTRKQKLLALESASESTFERELTLQI